MRKRRHVALIVTVAILLGFRTSRAKDFPCSDLRKAKASHLISALGKTDLDLSHGTGCYSDDEDNPKHCDWKVAVVEDRKIANDRRLIVVDSEHMTGSGAWIDVGVLGCQAGKITAILHDQFSESVDVEEATADKLVLRFPNWTGSVASCCPLLEERRVYVWNKEDHKYVLERDYAFPIAKP